MIGKLRYPTARIVSVMTLLRDAGCRSDPGDCRKMLMIYIMTEYKSVLSQECPLNLLVVVSSRDNLFTSRSD